MLLVCHPQQPQAASGISPEMQANEMPYALAAQGLGMTNVTRRTVASLGIQFPKHLVGINSRAVAIAKFNAEGVAAHGIDAHGADGFVDGFRF